MILRTSNVPRVYIKMHDITLRNVSGTGNTRKAVNALNVTKVLLSKTFRRH